MKEYKVGEQIVLEVQEVKTDSCLGCFFFSERGDCERPTTMGYCGEVNRSDGKNVIFVEKKGK